MSSRDLAKVYAQGKNVSSHKLVHRAVRAEIPGGAEAIELLNELRGRFDCDENNPFVRRALAGIRKIVGRMIYTVRQKYGMSVDPRDAPGADQPSDDDFDDEDAKP